jgi:hypothetical protein
VHVTGRSDRHAFFERIVALRDGYALSEDDRDGVLSIADAIRYSEAVLTAVELDIEPWLAEPDECFAADATHGSIQPSRGRPFASDL